MELRKTKSFTSNPDANRQSADVNCRQLATVRRHAAGECPVAEIYSDLFLANYCSYTAAELLLLMITTNHELFKYSNCLLSTGRRGVRRLVVRADELLL